MTLEEMQAAKATAEREITKALCNFEEQTGVAVNYCHLDRVDTRHMGRGGSSSSVVAATLEVKL